MAIKRPDRSGPHRAAYEKNRKRILATQSVCGICGKPVDKNRKAGDPLAPCIDHIVPVAKGGHPSAIENLQLTHWSCNRAKSDKIFKNPEKMESVIIGNRNLPQSKDWSAYRSE